ncbi:hypothetical protein [Heyndrickxia sp. FSL W8-0423]|uniref:hypothetical protein n=1 Tax=Heyndrickxia sp. FSL W8-0423 TaxID=2921601 RepID=UPI0030FCF0A9
MEVPTQEFYLVIINDLKNQIATLADQKATQVSLNSINTTRIQNLEQQLREVNEKKEELEKELLAEKEKNAGTSEDNKKV